MIEKLSNALVAALEECEAIPQPEKDRAAAIVFAIGCRYSEAGTTPEQEGLLESIGVCRECVDTTDEKPWESCVSLKPSLHASFEEAFMDFYGRIKAAETMSIMELEIACWVVDRSDKPVIPLMFEEACELAREKGLMDNKGRLTCPKS